MTPERREWATTSKADRCSWLARYVIGPAHGLNEGYNATTCIVEKGSKNDKQWPTRVQISDRLKSTENAAVLCSSGGFGVEAPRVPTFGGEGGEAVLFHRGNIFRVKQDS